MDLRRRSSVKTLASSNDSRQASTVSSMSSDQSWTAGSAPETTSTSPASSATGLLSPTLQPRPPRTPRRYPSDLSRRVKTRNVQGGPGLEEHAYESLEDLLRVNGFKETRIFTPESERFDTSEGDKPPGQPSGDDSQSSSNTRVGESVLSFLSGWVPGTSLALKRNKSPEAGSKSETADAGAMQSESPESMPSRGRAPQSPLAYKTRGRSSSLSLNTPQCESVTTHQREPLPQWNAPEHGVFAPSGSLTPSSSSSTIRPSAYQLLRKHEPHPVRKQSLANLSAGAKSRSINLAPPHQLRHANSTPNLARQRGESRRTRPRREPRHPIAREQSPATDSADTWVGTLTSLLTNTLMASSLHRGGAPPELISQDSAVFHDNTNKALPVGSRHRSPSPNDQARMSAPRLLQAIAGTGYSSAQVKTSNVLCRSAPSSRSTSRVRGEADGRRTFGANSRRSGPQTSNTLTSPLLSPSLASEHDDPITLLLENNANDDALLHFAAYQDPLRIRVDSDPEPPTLDAILSAHVASTNLKRQSSKGKSFFNEHCHVPTTSGRSSTDRDLASQRQRSIRSLRANLAASHAASLRAQTSHSQDHSDPSTTRKSGNSAFSSSHENIPPVPQLPPEFRLISPGGTSTGPVTEPNAPILKVGVGSSRRADPRSMASPETENLKVSSFSNHQPTVHRSAIPHPWLDGTQEASHPRFPQTRHTSNGGRASASERR